jgi:ubiquinone/menaquinone biosynthesis C-methylase UbiE
MIDMNSLKGFDESTYLKLNIDVFEAVQKGIFSSGWDHFISHGFGENRPGVPPELLTTVQNTLADGSRESVPPRDLRKRVHGDEDLSGFETIGRIVSFDIYGAINPTIELGEHDRILDFGCGCGRVIRYLHKLYRNSSFYGTDIDKEAILWCQRHLSGVGQFVTNEESPPLPFNDEFFDFVYSISVFTHLPEDMQFEWLDELRRVTKRGGYLLLTTHGKELFPATSEKSKTQLQEAGFYYSVGSGTEGLPGFYQTSFHTEEYVLRYWSKFFKVRRIIKKGVAKHQDLILCERSN